MIASEFGEDGVSSASRGMIPSHLEAGPVLRRDRLGGVLHEYIRQVA